MSLCVVCLCVELVIVIHAVFSLSLFSWSLETQKSEPVCLFVCFIIEAIHQPVKSERVRWSQSTKNRRPGPTKRRIYIIYHDEYGNKQDDDDVILLDAGSISARTQTGRAILKKEEEIGCGRELDFYVFQAETSSPDVAPNQPTNRTRKVYRVVDKHRCCTAEMCAASGFGTPSRDELSSSIFLWRFFIYFFFLFFCGRRDNFLLLLHRRRLNYWFDFLCHVQGPERSVVLCCAVKRARGSIGRSKS